MRIVSKESLIPGKTSKMVLEVYQHVDMYQLRAAVAAIGLLDPCQTWAFCHAQNDA